MEIKVDRKWKKEKYTIGRLYINSEFICNTIEDTDRGLTQSMSEEEIKSKKIYGKTAIPSGRYKILMNVVSPKFSQKEFYMNVCKGKVPRLEGIKGFSGVLIHCITADTEILTEFGWQNLESFKKNTPQFCFSYNTETNKIERTVINSFVEKQYNGMLYRNNGRRVNYAVTDKHRMYVGYRKRNGNYDWRFVEAQNLGNGQRKFITSAEKSTGESINEFQKNIYRLVIAVQADGYVLNWSNTASQIRFHLKKERKIERVKKLVESVGATYKVFVDCEGKTHISIDSKLSALLTEMLNPNRYTFNYKELPIELLNLESQDLKDLIFEYLFWDGRYETYKKNKSITISSTNENTIDMLQAMCCLSGLRTSKYLERAKKEKWHSNLWDLRIYENQSVVLPESNTYSSEIFNNIVWCISNDNETIVTRNNGRTVILGNCAATAANVEVCIGVGFNTEIGRLTSIKEAFEKVYSKLSSSKEDIWITIE